MASKKGVTRRVSRKLIASSATMIAANTPPILTAVRGAVSPLLDERPDGAMTTAELAEQSNTSVDVVRKKLRALRREGVLREARVRLPRGSYTVMYWLETKIHT